MSHANPYQPTVTTPVYAPQIRQVKVQPFELLRRGHDFIREQYWLFFGICLVGMLVASAVPFGIIMGPMLVGIYLCFLARERGETVEFAKLFEGFDSFKESFIATLVIIAATFVVIIPLMLVFVVGMVFLIDPQQNGPNDGPPIALFALMFAFYVVLLLVNMLIVLPFLFAFQLIADHNVSGIDAVKLSAKAVRLNLFGLIGYLIVTTVVSIVLMMMCYIPLFFFLPVMFASLFLMYRDIFPVDSNAGLNL